MSSVTASCCSDFDVERSVHINWAQIWIDLFGTTEWLGLNMGFWVANGVVLVIVIIMNVIFWSMKPLPKDE